LSIHRSATFHKTNNHMFESRNEACRGYFNHQTCQFLSIWFSLLLSMEEDDTILNIYSYFKIPYYYTFKRQKKN
jgi:hypothetical protein